MRLSGPIGLAVALAAASAQACLEINGWFLSGIYSGQNKKPFRAVDNGGQAVCETDNCNYLNRCDLNCRGNVNNAYVVNMEKLYWNTNHGNFVVNLNPKVTNTCERWCGIAGGPTCCGYALDYVINTRAFC